MWVIEFFCEHPVFFVDLLIVFGDPIPFALFPDQYTKTLGKGNVTVFIGIF